MEGRREGGRETRKGGGREEGREGGREERTYLHHRLVLPHLARPGRREGVCCWSAYCHGWSWREGGRERGREERVV
jgi:hypothetical protein